ncbi:MAG TPA: glycoside hydrolase family 28 protein [Bryobacteraceae bacterium]|nr:glycoside hydrolase family 28 protein [Bryobacteraceae bacterium]
MKLVIVAAFLGQALGLAAANFPVNRYGAKGDGQTVDTASIQKAIDAAAKSAGTVVFHPGTYLTGSLFLKSGMSIRLDEGVTLLGARDLAAYPIMLTRVAGIEMNWPAALLNVYRQHDVKILGKGTIDGDGKIWWDKYWTLRREYEPKGLRWASDYDCQRPRLIQIYDSANVVLSGLTLKRSGFWTVHICYSQNVTVDGVTVRNNEGGRGPSTDGIDIDSSSGVLVARCDLECNDDDICLKAGRDADGLRVNRPTHHVVIRDNTVRAGAAGVTFGSETSGGIHDVEASGTHVLAPVPIGILFKSAATRGGTIENIKIHDFVMEGVNTVLAVQFNWNPSYSYAQMPAGVPNPPDYWRVLTTPVPPEKGLPHLRGVEIDGIKAAGARQAFSVSSYKDSPLENFTLRDWNVEAGTAGSIRFASNWKLDNVHVETADGSKVIVQEGQ